MKRIVAFLAMLLVAGWLISVGGCGKAPKAPEGGAEVEGELPVEAEPAPEEEEGTKAEKKTEKQAPKAGQKKAK